MARKLIVEILADTTGLRRGLKQAKGEAEGFGRTIGTLRVGLMSLARATVVVEAVDKALEGLGETIRLGSDEVKERLQLQAQLSAVLKSTGDVANVSAGHVDELAQSLSNLSGIDDEVVKAGEIVLLSFSKIRNYAGRNNDVFDQATKAAADFAARTGRAMSFAALAIGKALQDPAKAASSLRRAYVVLTDDEKKAIKTALAHGDTLKAQRLILEDFRKRFGGAAEAAGKTLPGALNILRERFKDLAGDAEGLAVGPLTKLVTGLTGVVVKLSEAKGVKAKLRVVFEGATDLGRAIVDLVSRGVESAIAYLRGVNWAQLARVIQRELEQAFDQVRGFGQRLGRRVGDEIRSINWPAEISRAAAAVSRAAVYVLNLLSTALERVNWQTVGQRIAQGIGLALGAVIKFLASLDYGRIARALVRLLRDAIEAVISIVVGIAGVLGRAAVQGIIKGLDAMARRLERKALELALKIIEPFTHIPRWLGGGWAQDLQRNMQGALDKLAATANAGGKNVAANVIAGFIAGDVANAIVGAINNIQAATDAATNRTAADANRAAAATGPDVLPPPPGADGPATKRKGITAEQRNTFFDNAISRMLDRVQDLPLRKQIAALKRIQGLVAERLARTRDVTRRLTLEDEIISIGRQIKGVREQLQQSFFDALQFNIDKAGLTKTLEDDLRAWERYEAAVKRQIKVVGRTLDLEKDLLTAEQNIADIRKQQRENRIAARSARQFEALGLTATGEERTPGVTALQRRLRQLRAQLVASGLDSATIRKQLDGAAKVLAEGINKVGQPVRAAIDRLFDDIDAKLKNRPKDWTKFRTVNARQFIAAAGLDLTPGELRRLRTTLSMLGPNMTLPAVTASGRPIGAAAGVGVGGVTINGNVVLHGVTDPLHFEDQLIKRAKARPHRRRGAR